MRLASGRLLFEGVRCSWWYRLIDFLQRRIHYHATIPKPKMERDVRQCLQAALYEARTRCTLFAVFYVMAPQHCRCSD